MTTTAMHHDTVADVLLREGWIDKSQYNTALQEYERTRRSLLRIFTDMGAIDEDQRLNLLARTMHCKVVSLRDVTPRSDVAGYMTREVCRRRHVVPLQLEDGSVLVAMEDPTDVRTLSDLEKIFSRSVRPVLASTQEIMETIDKLPDSPDGVIDAEEPKESFSYTLVANLTLLLLVFIPIVAFYYYLSTETGKEWYSQFEFSTFENILVFVVVWGSWAAMAYFINDLIYGKSQK